MSYLRGFSTLGCPALELEAVCALARRHVVAVELRALGGTLDLAGHCAARFGTPAALAKAVRTSGVRVPVVGSSFALTDTDPAARAGLLALAPWAEASGARWLRVFDGKDCGSAAAEPQATLAWWREMRRAHGWQIDLAVETDDTLLTGAEICRFAVHSSAGSAISLRATGRGRISDGAAASGFAARVCRMLEPGKGAALATTTRSARRCPAVRRGCGLVVRADCLAKTRSPCAFVRRRRLEEG